MTSFGFFLSGEELSGPEILRSARTAEKAGFDRIWVSDHFHPWRESQGESPFVWTVLGAVAATTDLTMTTAVTCPTYRIHPAILAQATATLTTLAPGRFRFGVGSGENLNEHLFGDAWPPVSVRQDRLAESLELIRKLWTGEVVTHQGEHFTVYNARIFSLPQELPPILVSGFGPQAAELAAKVGDGFMNVQPDGDLVHTYEKAGGTGLKQGGLKICYGTDADAAAKTAYEQWGHEGIGGQAAQELPLWTQFDALAEANSPEAMAETVSCGPDPERAADQIRQYVEAGYDEVYISQMGPDQDGAIRFLQDQVLPLL